MIRRGLVALALLRSLLPAPAVAADTLPEWRYTLRPGDTLIGLAQRYLAQPAAWPRLQRYNRIADPYRLIPGNSLHIPLAWLAQTPAPVGVVAVSGDVRVTPPGEPARPLRAGDTLFAGAQLASSADGSASLRFADGSTLVLQAGARLSLDTVSVYAGGGMADTRLRLQQGRIETQANPRRVPGSRLQIITPSAVAAVRGTRFRLGADASATREETLHGEVTLDAAGHGVAVGAGQGSLAEAGKPPMLPVALLPPPDLSALPARVERLPLVFELPRQAGAAAWVGQLAPDARFEQVLRETEAAAPRLVFADLPDGDYVLRARAVDARGLQGRDALHTFVLDARPFPPSATAPGARVREAWPTLRWSVPVGSEATRLQLARDGNFAAPLVDARLDGGAWRPDAPLEPGHYQWRVASIVGGDFGPFSPPRAFHYDPLPGAPDVESTAPLFDGSALVLSLPPPPPGLHYELLVSSDAQRRQVLWQGESRDGSVRTAPVEPTSTRFLAARLVEADGSAGPYAVRRIEAPPPPRWPALLLLLPLILAL